MKPLQDALSPEVKAELVKPWLPYDPRDAEIVLDVTPRWYVIEIHEPAQRDVTDELIARRFGIFVPEMDKTVVTRGRKLDRVLPMFPGYIFVFVWDINRHWSRIINIPGVMRIMGMISDEDVDHIRKIENIERPLRGPAAKKKRRHNRRRRHDDEVIAVYPFGLAFDDRLLTLDSGGRNQLLRLALGLSS